MLAHLDYLLTSISIYGQKTDPILGTLLNMGDSGTWIPHLVQ